MSKRIYVVTGPDENRTLVRANVSTQAISHVVQSMFKAEIAKQEDLVFLLGVGKVVETFGE
jgi:hypothetical protein